MLLMLGFVISEFRPKLILMPNSYNLKKRKIFFNCSNQCILDLVASNSVQTLILLSHVFN
ncbi:hypothetical protein BpHYR1_004477 [Brachionus plicatilis]|uniref:Uncharacterized protein n=1 Tax=Brachionus plicatilis TaxID=10195 RepID=A0A3M7S9Y2_BRAPC|nr:hypothetical protein BpHYR1_004477 [Brachionus plicatilis]